MLNAIPNPQKSTSKVNEGLKNLIKISFIFIVFILFSGCKKTVTPPVQATTHTIMLVNWSRYDVFLQNVYLFDTIDQSLNRDLMGHGDLWGRDTVILNTNEIEYKVQRHPHASSIDWHFDGLYIGLYDNGVLRQTYQKQPKEFYIRYKAD
jgi:hypothetical protein